MTEKLKCQNGEMMNGRYCDNPAEWTATCPSVVGGTWQTVYCWRCKDVGVGHVVTSWARIHARTAAQPHNAAQNQPPNFFQKTFAAMVDATNSRL